MTYRTRKYLIRTVLYTLFLLLSVTVFIFGAHQKKLPAVFEKYTGDFVREHTEGVYDRFFSDHVSQWNLKSQRYKGAMLWSILDSIAREPGYVYASDLLDSLSEQMKTIAVNRNRQEMITRLRNEISLTEWLKEPGGMFASVYKYEFIRNIETFKYIDAYGVFDNEGKPLWQSRNFSYPLKKPESTPIQINPTGFSFSVNSDEKILGYVQGYWNPWQFPDLPVSGAIGKGVFSIVLNNKDEVISDIIVPEIYEQYFSGNDQKKYNGPLGGRRYPSRFLSSTRNQIKTVLIYPAAGTGYYFFKIGLYLILVILLVMAIKYTRRLYLLVTENKPKARSTWLEEGLSEAVALNRDTLKLAHESQAFLTNMKVQENSRLEKIAMHLSGIQRQVNQRPVVVTSIPESHSNADNQKLQQENTTAVDTKKSAEPRIKEQESPEKTEKKNEENSVAIEKITGNTSNEIEPETESSAQENDAPKQPALAETGLDQSMSETSDKEAKTENSTVAPLKTPDKPEDKKENPLEPLIIEEDLSGVEEIIENLRLKEEEIEQKRKQKEAMNSSRVEEVAEQNEQQKQEKLPAAEPVDEEVEEIKNNLKPDDETMPYPEVIDREQGQIIVIDEAVEVSVDDNIEEVIDPLENESEKPLEEVYLPEDDIDVSLEVDDVFELLSDEDENIITEDDKSVENTDDRIESDSIKTQIAEPSVDPKPQTAEKKDKTSSIMQPLTLLEDIDNLQVIVDETAENAEFFTLSELLPGDESMQILDIDSTETVILSASIDLKKHLGRSVNAPSISVRNRKPLTDEEIMFIDHDLFSDSLNELVNGDHEKPEQKKKKTQVAKTVSDKTEQTSPVVGRQNKSAPLSVDPELIDLEDDIEFSLDQLDKDLEQLINDKHK